MEIIPAIDIKNGKCVRLRQGDMDEVTVFDDDPLAVAARWVEAGARRLHVVDLDGAKAGQPVNGTIAGEIAGNHPEVMVQVGGGIRDADAIEAYLEAGVQYCVIGTKAVSEPHFVADVCLQFPKHILVGLDARDGKVAIDGWSKLSNHDVIDMAQHLEGDGVEAIIYTDIGRDGMLKGLNIESTRELAQAVAIPVIASGGVTSLDDIRAVCGAQEDGLAAVIVGRALYEGAVELADCLALAEASG